MTPADTARAVAAADRVMAENGCGSVRCTDAGENCADSCKVARALLASHRRAERMEEALREIDTMQPERGHDLSDAVRVAHAALAPDAAADEGAGGEGGASGAIRDGLAVWLLAKDECESVAWAEGCWRNNIEYGQSGHRGDCTKEAFTCAVCFVEEYRKAADACLAHLRAEIPGFDALLDGSAVVVPRDVVTRALGKAMNEYRRQQPTALKRECWREFEDLADAIAASPFAGEK